LCPTCRAELGWIGDTVGTKSQVNRWLIKQQQERAADVQAWQMRAADAAQAQEEFNRRVGLAARRLWGAIIGGVRAAVVSPIAALDRWLYTMSDESRSLYRALQVIWFVLIPMVVVSGLWLVRSATRQEAAGERAGLVAAPVEPAAEIAPAEVKEPGNEAARVVPPQVAADPVPRAEESRELIHDIRGPDLPVAPPPQPVMPLRADAAEVAADIPIDRDEPPPAVVELGNRPAVVDGAEIAERAEQARAREERNRRVAEIEKEIERLSKERRVAQDNEKTAAARDAYDARMGYGDPLRNPFSGVPGEARQRYKVEADSLLEQMRSLREEMNKLKRDAVRERRQ
jgi:hypothetical protein